MENYYKVFFTITFDYQYSKKKTITKFFKSDVDLGPLNFKEKINDENIYLLWNKYAIETSIKNLNPDTQYHDKKIQGKKVATHRIINTKTLSEVFTR